MIHCQAQQRIEKTIEIILTGAVPGSAQTAIMEDETDISCTCEEEIQETNSKLQSSAKQISACFLPLVTRKSQTLVGIS